MYAVIGRLTIFAAVSICAVTLVRQAAADDYYLGQRGNTSSCQSTTSTTTTTRLTKKSERSTKNNEMAEEEVPNGNSLLPVVINTWAFRQANIVAWNTLNSTEGGLNQTLNAVVDGCSYCEIAQCDTTVGFGGSPDENGETRLDALVMDGATMNIGAVGSMRRIKEAIKVARAVLEHTLHTLLVGDAATQFATSMGFEEESLTTTESRAMWEQWRARNCQPNYWLNVYPEPTLFCGPYNVEPTLLIRLLEERQRFKIGLDNHDTIGMIAIDANGQIHAGTSTNGARYKIPGRVGDSPIPGAGAYADNEVGAAVATGDGDIMMRFLPSLLAVEAMRSGKTPDEAADAAMRRIIKHYQDFTGALVVIDKFGNYSAACVGMDEFPYSITNRNSKQIGTVEFKKCIKPTSMEVIPLKDRKEQHKKYK